MLPDPRIPSLTLIDALPSFMGGGPLQIHAFGILVATGIALGMWLAVKRAGELGLDENIANDVGMWAVVPGFIFAHVYEIVFYQTDRLFEEPLLLFKVWDGISSMGGFIGGAAGVIFFLWRNKAPFWAYADPIIYGFAFAWIFGRTGCTVAFDHPGNLSDFFLAFDYQAGAVSPGARHNLGFYEVLWALSISAFFWSQRKKSHRPGFYLIAFVLSYMPIRLGLDFLRVADTTYLGLTAAQYTVIAMFLLMATVAWRRRNITERLVYGTEVHIFPDGRPAWNKPGSSKEKPHAKKKKKKK